MGIFQTDIAFAPTQSQLDHIANTDWGGSSMAGTETGAGTGMGMGSGFIGAGIGMQVGSAVTSVVNGFLSAKTAKLQGKLQAQLAMGNAYNKADALRFNADSIARLAGEQEYALYTEQQRQLDSMEVRAANSGLAMEGSVTELLSSQAGVNAQNRDSLIRDSKNQQYQMILGSQQAITEGKNQAAYYKAMSKANAASGIWGGIASGLAGLSSASTNFGMASAAGYI